MKNRIYKNQDSTILLESLNARYLWTPTILKVKVNAIAVPKQLDEEGNEIEVTFNKINVFRHEGSKIEYKTGESTQLEYESSRTVTFNVTCQKYGEDVGVLNPGDMLDIQSRAYGYDDRAEVLEVIQVPGESQEIVNCRIPEICKDLEFITVKTAETPEVNFADGEYTEQVYFDGACEKQNLKKDLEWEVCLMPPSLVKQKHVTRLNAQEEAELAKQSPDSIELFKCLREREAAPRWDDLTTYEKSLENLDKRVQGGEEDKPVVRQKIEAKIQELQNG